MVFDQPINPVVRATPFFVGGECHDDVAIRLPPLSPVTNEARDPEGCLCLVVSRTAPVEETIPFGQLKRVHAPIFTLRFDYISVGQKQERLSGAGGAATGPQI